MTIPRRLAPTVGPAHGGFEFLKGSFKGIKGYVVGWMTKSRHSKLYIDDVGWGPKAHVGWGPKARSVSRALSWTSAPTSSRRLSGHNPPRFKQL